MSSNNTKRKFYEHPKKSTGSSHCLLSRVLTCYNFYVYCYLKGIFMFVLNVGCQVFVPTVYGFETVP